MKIKLLTETAKVPTKGAIGSAGYDIYSDNKNKLIILPGTMMKIHTGIAVDVPEGYFAGIFARSGMAFKHSGRPINCVGVIDHGYIEEVIVGLYNDSDRAPIVIEPGERIAQMILLPFKDIDFEVVDELTNDTDRNGGFGSTGEF